MRTRFADLDVNRYRLPSSWTRRLLSPALIVDLPLVRSNLSRILALCGDDPGRWRPHIKTTKIPEVYAEMVRAGLRQFKCATLREAETLLAVVEREQATGADLLFAYPLVGPALQRLGRLAAERPGVTFSVLCEDPAAVSEVPASVGVFVDLDPGMHRTGAALGSHDRIHAVAGAAGDRLRGVHFYDGHIHGENAEQRRSMAHAGYRRLMEVLDDLRSSVVVGEIVTSGTPAFRYALDFEPFAGLDGTKHRVSPGTVVFHDLRSEQELDDLNLTPAAVVFARVVSHPGDDRVTVDAGSKSIAAEAGDPCAFAIGHPELEALTPSEEHLPFKVHGADRPARGAEVYLVPRHVCPTVNLAEQALIVDGEHVFATPVRARAHDLLVD